MDTQSRSQSRSPPQIRIKDRSRTRSRSPLWALPKMASSAKPWKTEKDQDVSPSPKRFLPARPPGHQLNSNSTYTPLDLFKLFFSNNAVKTICQQTNKQATKNIANGKQYLWHELNIQYFKYVGLSFFFALVKRKGTLFSVYHFHQMSCPGTGAA